MLFTVVVLVVVLFFGLWDVKGPRFIIVSFESLFDMLCFKGSVMFFCNYLVYPAEQNRPNSYMVYPVEQDRPNSYRNSCSGVSCV